MSDQPPFQFKLRTVFIANFFLALLAGIIRACFSDDGQMVILATAAWLLGVTGLIVLTAIGEACGREYGALAGVVIGCVLWTVAVLATWRAESSLIGHAGAAVIHGIAIAGTTWVMIQSAIRRIRCQNPDDEHFVEMAQHLLDDQRRRRASGQAADAGEDGQLGDAP